ncbi:MAG: MarR family transcriptional regulator [Chloroflexi bacterium]|nr:MarR family transcriptional regulator [Chloroflexota bacterium]MCY3582458.1 MarR family transcriptional regulator [Chloroflexota bacterium]MCY3717387.1 MarR family transcriptional regulator [Chloroflexota bacterium]MDE2651127.1 MarR family transcriptional regulator [Chloroflexota bacterium]MXV93106.1 MarR family transcriptional regulator [Chloroflexota bacterium]
MDNVDMCYAREPGDPPGDSFEQRFFSLLARIFHRLKQFGEYNTPPGLLSPPQLWFLRRLYDAGAPQPVSYFADGIYSNRSNASQMIDRLEAEGLVCRVRNPRDRRSVLVELTESGERSMHHGTTRHQELAEQLLRPLSDEERRTTLEALERVLSLLENHLDADDTPPNCA